MCHHSHNLHEVWLHPLRYRTILCTRGTICFRNICFFAHSIEELRDTADPLPTDVRASNLVFLVLKMCEMGAYCDRPDCCFAHTLPEIIDYRLPASYSVKKKVPQSGLIRL
jgi:hypothetical protein